MKAAISRTWRLLNASFWLLPTVLTLAALLIAPLWVQLDEWLSYPAYTRRMTNVECLIQHQCSAFNIQRFPASVTTFNGPWTYRARAADRRLFPPCRYRQCRSRGPGPDWRR